MSDNPYAFGGTLPAAHAAVDERATFLKKVYSLLLGGMLTFALTLWAGGNVPVVSDMMIGLWNTIAGAGMFGMLIYVGIMMGGFALVHAVARVKPLNLIVYFGWSFLLGLLVGPLVLVAASQSPAVLTQASIMTALIFTGLTAFVFVTGKDFSFLRGILFLGMWVLLIVGIAGVAFGFGSPLLLSGLGILLWSGFILYDTSKILHRYPTTMAVSAAAELLTDVVYLFWNLLLLLFSLANSD